MKNIKFEEFWKRREVKNISEVIENVIILDGHQTIGGNKILVNHPSGFILLLDFGMNFKRKGELFDEFLRIRTQAGLSDYLISGLLPPYKNFYRSDLVEITPKNLWIDENVSPEYVVISHAHLDHMGLVGFLREDMRFILTQETLAIMKAIEVTGLSHIEYEYTVFKKRVGGIRPTRASEKEDFPRHVETSPPDFLKLLPIDHSIPGSSMVLVDMGSYYLIYSGDFRFSGHRKKLTEKTVDTLANIERKKIVLVEGTRFSSKNPIGTEEDVMMEMEKIMKKYEGKLIIVDFGQRNVDRLKTTLEVSKVLGRKVIVTPKMMYLLLSLTMCDSSYENLLKSVVWYRRKRKEKKWIENLKDFPSSDYEDISSDPGSYIMCFTYYDILELVDILIPGKTKGGAYIYSNTEPFNEEMEIDFKRLNRWVEDILKMDFHGSNEKSFLHVSGHASIDEIVDFLKKINANLIIPIHTEKRREFAKFLEEKGFKVQI